MRQNDVKISDGFETSFSMNNNDVEISDGVKTTFSMNNLYKFKTLSSRIIQADLILPSFLGLLCEN